MNYQSKFYLFGMALLGVLASGLVGCQDAPIEEFTPPALRKPKVNPVAGVDAGVEVKQSAKDIKIEANSKLFATRLNPFTLTSAQAKFEREQFNERVTSSMGGWFSEVQVPEEKEIIPTVEPQPYRRLSGIIVGSSILALIDMGDGREVIVRPGQQIPGTAWTIASIDGDKATLTREGNVLPKIIYVPLQGKIPVLPGAGSGSGNTNPGDGGQPSPGSRGRGRAGGGPGGRAGGGEGS